MVTSMTQLSGNTNHQAISTKNSSSDNDGHEMIEMVEQKQWKTLTQIIKMISNI